MNNPAPFAFEEARTAARHASEAQADLADRMVAAMNDRAVKENAYRRALADMLIHARGEEGIAWSAASDVARGHETVAQLRLERDLADAVVEGIRQNAYRHAADRRSLEQFTDWSMRVNTFDDYRATTGMRVAKHHVREDGRVTVGAA